jgi:hypothetical protein
MRIIKPDAVIVSLLFINPKDRTLYWHDADTIEISDAQLDWIGWNHYNDCWNEYDGWTKGLAQYLSEIILLAGEGK